MDVEISRLGLRSVELAKRVCAGKKSVGGWRGFLGQVVDVEKEEYFYVLEGSDGRQFYRSPTPHKTLHVEWQYVIRGTELWAVAVGLASSFLDGKMDVKLVDLPEEVVDGNAILPEGWVAEYWPTCYCGYDGHPGQLLFESEVKDYLQKWLASRSHTDTSLCPCGQPLDSSGNCPHCDYCSRCGAGIAGQGGWCATCDG
jgi:hypothetical protein